MTIGATGQTADTPHSQHDTDAPPGVPRFREHLANQVRAEAARQHVSGRELARRLGRSRQWADRRLTAESALDTDDIEEIARAIGVPLQELLAEAARRADAEAGAAVPIPQQRGLLRRAHGRHRQDS